MGAGTLGVISWAEHTYDEAVAHTMGFVTFSLFTLLFSIATKDERRNHVQPRHLVRQDLRSPPPGSPSTLILATVLGPLQALLDTTTLTFRLWPICLGLASTILSSPRSARRSGGGISPAPGHPG